MPFGLPLASVLNGVLGLMLIESVLLVMLRVAFHRGPPVSAWLFSMSAGCCLVSGWKCWLAGQTFALVGLCLSGALVAHLVDLFARLGRSADATSRQARMLSVSPLQD